MTAPVDIPLGCGRIGDLCPDTREYQFLPDGTAKVRHTTVREYTIDRKAAKRARAEIEKLHGSGIRLIA